MNPDVLLSWLESESPTRRLSAARGLRKSARESDRQVIQQALSDEVVPWVRSALEVALDRLNGNQSVPSPPPSSGLNEIGEDQIQEIHASAVSDTIGHVLHELEPAIGAIRVILKREWDMYPGSESEKYLEQLSDILDIFSDWRRAEQSPRINELDLAKLIDGIIAHVLDSKSRTTGEVRLPKVELVGDRPFVVKTDRRLIGIAVANGLRNAIEATGGSQRPLAPIILNWGSTNSTFWISIQDQGVGLTEGATVAYHDKRSTKPGHKGLGLPIAFRAINALKGDIDLSNNSNGGANFYIEVPGVNL